MLPLRDELPTRRRPIVTYALIALNVLAYLYESAAVAALGPRFVVAWGLVPARFFADPAGELPNVLTSMFLHAPDTWWHLASNMLFLWIFGDNVEDALGRGRYLAFYLLSGVGAAAAQVLIDPSSTVPMVGASGAIAGVLAAYGSLHPASPITVLNPIVPLWLFFGPLFRLPAWLVILEFFVVNLVSGLSTLGGARGGVAFFAHLGGFVAGLVLVRFFFDDRDRRRRAEADAWRPPPRNHLVRDEWRRPPGRGRSPRW
ncbi:MAG: rhomboid family intramembrane serine protease [Deltaproteobacteria bacterium]|nr:rhomboid family intramembrane serine protease [Deltaproteobacteria bacterium]